MAYLASTWAAIATITAATATSTVSAVEGNKAGRRATRSRKDSKEAQTDAEARQASTQRTERQRIAETRKKKPDASALLSEQQDSAGLGSTILSGSGGVASNQLRVGRSTLLGE